MPKIPRPISFTLLVFTFIVAYLSRTRPIGFYPWDKSAGDALYAFAIYLELLLIVPTLRPLPAWILATAFCLMIESFKLTGLPAAWATTSVGLPCRLILGTTPSLHNVLCYLLATTLAALLHIAFRRVLNPPAPPDPCA